MSKCKNCSEYNTEKHYCPQFCKVIENTSEDLRMQGARGFAEKIKSEIEKYWYRSELDMGAENVNNLIDCVLAELQKEMNK